MILGPTIEQLRAHCPVFAGRVAGAADFQLGLKNYNENMALPAAYVVPLDQESRGNQVMTGLIEVIDKTVAVVVELDATPDRRGQDPTMSYDAIETQLFGAMLLWAPEPCRVPNGQGYQFTGGRFLDLDRARVFYQWEFLLPWQITDGDAWDVDFDAVPLCGIELDVYKAPPWDMPPQDNRPPAAVAKIITGCVDTIWDDGTVWDDETNPTVWDQPL